MQVTIKLYGTLSEYLPAGAKGRRAAVELPEGATVDDLAEALGFGEVSCVFMRGSEQVHRAQKLEDGDTVSAFPPIAGG
jgi:molybdopterin converting factor small subunit